MKKIKKAILYTDGACKGNPGPSAAGFVLYNVKKDILSEGSIFLGTMTNNQAEYNALILGLERALEMGIKDLSIRMDSELIVMQLNGAYKIKNEGLLPLYLEVRRKFTLFTSIKIEHIERSLNSEADRLANLAFKLDKRATGDDR